MNNTVIYYSNNEPHIAHELSVAVQNADDKTRISFFHGDKLVFHIWKNKVVDMIADKSMVVFMQKRCADLGINYDEVVAK